MKITIEVKVAEAIGVEEIVRQKSQFCDDFDSATKALVENVTDIRDRLDVPTTPKFRFGWNNKANTGLIKLDDLANCNGISIDIPCRRINLANFRRLALSEMVAVLEAVKAAEAGMLADVVNMAING